MRMSDNKLDKLSTPESLSGWLREYCNERAFSGWHNYGAADPKGYMNSSPRMMLINSESGGYQDCPDVPSDEYLVWIKDRWKTPRFASVLVAAIKQLSNELYQGMQSPGIVPDEMRKLYQSTNRLLDDMRTTIYMNARITSNDSGSPNEQTQAVRRDAKEFAAYRKRFVEVWNPEIVICAGKSACESLFLEEGLHSPDQLLPSSVFRLGGRTFVVTPHLSRPNAFGGYEFMASVALEAAKMTFSSK